MSNDRLKDIMNSKDIHTDERKIKLQNNKQNEQQNDRINDKMTDRQKDRYRIYTDKTDRKLE